MSQIVANRSFHASLLIPSSGSLQERAEKLKPPSFISMVLPREERVRGGAASRASPITARRTLDAEPTIVPVTPEDVPEVCVEFKNSCWSLLQQMWLYCLINWEDWDGSGLLLLAAFSLFLVAASWLRGKTKEVFFIGSLIAIFAWIFILSFVNWASSDPRVERGEKLGSM